MNRLKRRSRLCVGCKTYIGNTRDENQDSIVLRALQQQQKYFVVAAVCDGIGGLEHGELASQIVIKQIEEWYLQINSWIDIETVDIETPANFATSFIVTLFFMILPPCFILVSLYKN